MMSDPLARTPTRSIDEARYLRLYAKLAEVLGTEEALTLMELLVPERFEQTRTSPSSELTPHADSAVSYLKPR